MRISPVNFTPKASLNPNFKANFKPNANSDNPIKTTKSEQNNSPEFFIPTEQYLGLLGYATLREMDTSGFLDGIENQFKKEMSEDEMDDALSTIGADRIIQGIRIGATHYGLMPKELKGQIPKFVSISTSDYFKTQYEALELLSDFDLTQLTPDIDSDGENEDTASLFDIVQSCMDDGDFMSELAQQQKVQLEILQTKRLSELQEALDIVSDSINYMLYRVIGSNFDRDPRSIINTLFVNKMVYIAPTVEDNGNGTLTFTYNDFPTGLKVIRNRFNGDYIMAEGISSSENETKVYFNKDGSIKELDFYDTVDKSKIQLSSSDDGGLDIYRISKGKTTKTHFVKNSDGSIKQA